MLSFRRSGLLALTLMGGFIANAQAQTQRMSHQAWVSDVSIERLEDKSVLTEYFGEGPSSEHDDVIFRVGFIPRFGCAPLITLKFGDKALSQLKLPMFNEPDVSSLVVTIDGSPLAFEGLIDKNTDHASVYMNANLQRRLTTRLRVEVGDRMKVKLPDGNTLNFSLLGSRDSISIANQNCRLHDPSIQG